jgi:cysteine-S-conjugate beta-lyase
MNYDFDEVQDRRGTGCLKYDATRKRKGRDDLLPLWVADMDFALPEDIRADISAVAAHGIFGYGFTTPTYLDAVRSWYARHHDWQTEREWIVQTPGVVFALGVAIQAFSVPGDAILIQQPVYYPFASIVEANGRVLVNNELVYEDGRYRIDFDDFETKIREQNVKVFILCSPHNPVGRVWSAAELIRMGQICAAHGVVVVADEIHGDFAYPEHTHRVFPTLDEAFPSLSVVCTAPSKTFNIAGLQVANIFISDPELRRRFCAVLNALGYEGVSTIALTAAQSVYTKGEDWLRQLKEYLVGNLAYIRAFLQEELPQIRLIEPEGTYLVWLDCSALGLSDRELEELIVNKAHLWLDAGSLFGQRSGQFERVNIACPRALLKQACAQLAHAVDTLSR